MSRGGREGAPRPDDVDGGENGGRFLNNGLPQPAANSTLEAQQPKAIRRGGGGTSGTQSDEWRWNPAKHLGAQKVGSSPVSNWLACVVKPQPPSMPRIPPWAQRNAGIFCPVHGPCLRWILAPNGKHETSTSPRLPIAPKARLQFAVD